MSIKCTITGALFTIIALGSTLLATEPLDTSAKTQATGLSAEEPNDIPSIDKELQVLSQQLKGTRKSSSNEELDAQRYFRANSNQYVEKIQQDENDEKRIKEIKEKIARLQKKKALLLKNTPSSSEKN